MIGPAVVLLLLSLVVAAACAPSPSLSPTISAVPTPPRIAAGQLGIENGTTLEISLVVNGTEVARVSPKSGRVSDGSTQVGIPNLPAPPWDVEARTSTGRLLLELLVEPGDLVGLARTGVEARVSLSCGRLIIWGGVDRPSGPALIPSLGVPGDCVP